MEIPVCGEMKMENKTKVIFDYFMDYEERIVREAEIVIYETTAG